jgi:hypothetical protein
VDASHRLANLLKIDLAWKPPVFSKTKLLCLSGAILAPLWREIREVNVKSNCSDVLLCSPHIILFSASLPLS